MDKKIKTYYRLRLPHIHPIGAAFFITFRLADALPIFIIKELKEKLLVEKEKIPLKPNKEYKKEYLRLQKKIFGKYDQQLDDKPYGKCHLRKAEVAGILQDVLHEKDNEDYELIAYTIMPNHAHILIDLSLPSVKFDLGESNTYRQIPEIMRRIKGKSARFSNQILGRKGKFWAKESYDHYIRNEKEFNNVISYILNNPVNAGLIQNWEDWEYSYIKKYV